MFNGYEDEGWFCGFSMLEAVCLTASFGMLLFFSIKEAKENSAEGDIVLIAGKGHEDYQELKNNKRIQFDDFKIAKQIFNK